MRVMAIVKATPESEAGQMPTEQLLSEMLAYNEELVKAGIMLAGDSLRIDAIFITPGRLPRHLADVWRG